MTDDQSSDIVAVRAPEGIVSVELAKAGPDTARLFMHCSPRALNLSDPWAWKLGASLSDKGYEHILARDNRKMTLGNALSGRGWKVRPAIEPLHGPRYNMVTTHDLPLDEDLIDEHGRSLELSNTAHMVGVRVELGDRDTWAFYTDEGETARVVTDSERRCGMLVASSGDDIALVADHLVRFLVTARKKWAVFSTDMEARLTHLHPARAALMDLEEPGQFDHSVAPLSRSTRGDVVTLFSEYYDEGRLSAMARLRRLVRDKCFSVHVADGGFVVVKHEGDSGLIYDIYVTPSKQGEGIGDELMRCALTTISQRSRRAYLRTSYPRARRLYEKFGFRESSCRLVVRLDEALVTKVPSR